jgi:hypothetical protein
VRPADLQRTAGPLVDSRETSLSPDPKPPPRAHPPALRPWSHGASQGQLGAGGARLTWHRSSRFAHGQISRARRSSESSSLQVHALNVAVFTAVSYRPRPRRRRTRVPGPARPLASPPAEKHKHQLRAAEQFPIDASTGAAAQRPAATRTTPPFRDAHQDPGNTAGEHGEKLAEPVAFQNRKRSVAGAQVSAGNGSPRVWAVISSLR